MPRIEKYPVYKDKIIVLLKRRRDNMENWLVNQHAPALSSRPAVKKYVASIVDETFRDSSAKLTGGTDSDPYGIGCIDELWGCRWEDVAGLYDQVSVIGAYRTTEYLIRELITDRPCGRRWPEPKRIGFLFRPESKTHAEAMAHWLTVHAGKVIKHITGMAAYNQNHIEQKLTGSSPDADGINCLLFWNMDAIRYGYFSRADSYVDLQGDCDNFRRATYTFLTYQYVFKQPDVILPRKN